MQTEYWNEHVNTRFYGADNSYEANREQVSFKSGRTIFYLKNSKPKRSHAVNLMVEDKTKVDGKTEFEWFLYWYENTVKSGTVAFYLKDFESHEGYKAYYLGGEPSWKGQQYKELSLQINEV